MGMEGKRFCFCIPCGKKTKAKDDSETPMSCNGGKNNDGGNAQTGHGNHDGVASHDAGGGMAAAMMASSHVSQMEGIDAAEGSSHGGAGHGGGGGEGGGGE